MLIVQDYKGLRALAQLGNHRKKPHTRIFYSDSTPVIVYKLYSTTLTNRSLVCEAYRIGNCRYIHHFIIEQETDD